MTCIIPKYRLLPPFGVVVEMGIRLVIVLEILARTCAAFVLAGSPGTPEVRPGDGEMEPKRRYATSPECMPT